MKRTSTLKWIVSTVLCLALVFALLPTAVFAETGTAEVGTWDEFTTALADSSVTTITLTGNIASPQESGDLALVIGSSDRAVTITGGQITVKNAGIILGGDVTFQNIELYFANSVRNAILANGHSLTLDTVTNTSEFDISLFCGGVTDYCGSNISEIPATGTDGHITIKGTNSLGNIYAGSLSDVVDDAADSPNEYTGNATITIVSGASGMGGIYAHGAREDRSGGNYNVMLNASAKYTVSGGVTINLSNATTTVDGATGSSSNAVVNYVAANGNEAVHTLENIGALTLSGTTPNLAPAANSTIDTNASVTVPNGARLDLTNFTNIIASGSLTIDSLSGGGTLVLGSGQMLTITGAVTGETDVAIGGVGYDGNSTTSFSEDTVYITTGAEIEGSFVALSEDYVLENDNGSWTAVIPEIPVAKPASFAIPVSSYNCTVSKMATEFVFVETICEKPNDLGEDVDFFFSDIPLTIAISKDGAAAVTADREYSSWGYLYSPVHGIVIETTDGDNGITLKFYPEDDTDPDIAGEYTITITAPLASGETASAAFTLTVTEDPVVTYAVAITETTNGTVTADKTEAAAGETVTLTVTPATGYALSGLTVTDADSNVVTVTDNTFSMPASAVTVTAAFALCNHTGGTATYTVNADDSTKHDATYDCCGGIVTEDHDYATGICVCGDVGYAYDKTTNTYSVYKAAAMQSALDAAGVSGTAENPAVVKLMANLDVPGVALDPNYPEYPDHGVVIQAGVMTIDLNGCTLSNSDAKATLVIGKVDLDDNYVPGGSQVTIIDSSSGKTGAIESTWGSTIKNYDNLTIDSGTFTSRIYNYGTLTVNGGKFDSEICSEKLDTDPSLIVNGGKISGTNAIQCYNGSVNISGGTFSASRYALYISANVLSVSVTGGSFTGGECDIQANSATGFLGVGEDGKGATFPDAFAVLTNPSIPVNQLLAESAGYFDANGNQITEGLDKMPFGGTVTVGCIHSTCTYSVSGYTITESCAKCKRVTGTATISAADKTYDGTALEATVEKTGSIVGEITVTYESQSDFQPLAGAPVNAGSYVAYITLGGESSLKISFEIKKADPTIVTAPTAKTSLKYTGEPQQLLEAAGSAENGTMEYSADDGETWYTNIEDIKGTNAALYGVKYRVVGDANYNTVVAEEYISVEIERIDPDTSVLSSWNWTATYGQTLGDVTLPENWRWVDGADTSVGNAGENKFSVQYVDGIGNYNVITVEVTVTVSAKQIYIAPEFGAALADVVYNESGVYTLTVTGVTFKGVGDDNIVPLTLGTDYTATATQTDVSYGDLIKAVTATVEVTLKNGNYQLIGTAAISATANIVEHEHEWTYTADGDTITATCGNADTCPDAEQSITISAAGKTYDGDPVEATLTGSIEGVTTPTISYSGNTNAGTYTANITIEGKTASVEFTITKADAVFTAPEAETGLIYSGSAQALITAGSTEHGTMQYSLDNASWSAEIPTATNAGEYTVYYKVVGDSNHNDTASASVTVTIGQMDLSGAAVTLGTALTYNGTAQTQSIASVTLNGLNLTAGDYTVTGNQQTNTGDYTLTITGTGNFTGEVTADWSIAKASMTITADNVTVIVGKAAPDVSALTYTVTGLVNGETADDALTKKPTLSYAETPDTTKEGSYTINISGAEATNYTITYVIGTLTVSEKTAVTITVNVPANLVYDGTDQSDRIKANITAVDTATGEAVTVAGYEYEFSADPINAGSYTLTVSVVDSDEQYVGSVNVSVIIAKRSLTLKADNKSAYVNDSEPEYTFTVTGLLTGHSASGAVADCADADMTKAGTYDITISTAGLVIKNGETDVTANYAVTTEKGTLTVRKYNLPVIPTPTPTPDPEPEETVTVPVTDEDNTVEVEVTVTEGKATVEDLEKVVDDDSSTVTIDFSELDEKITEVKLPREVVEKIAETAGESEQTLEIVMSDGVSIEFNASALNEQVQQTGGISLTVSIVSHEDAKLTHEQKTVVGDRPAYDVSVTSDGKNISNMGGKITVTVPYELRSGEKPGGLIVYYVDDHGKRERCDTHYDAKNKRLSWQTDHLSLYMLDYDEKRVEACDGGEYCPINAFTDTDNKAWYHNGVHYCIENDLMNGISDVLFAPNGTTTRAQIVTILWRLEGKPVVNYLMQFEDVASESWYTEAVRWASSENIVGGYGNGKFGPNDTITRQQMAAILYRYCQYKGIDVSVGEDTNILSYTDAFSISEWAIPAMQWACGSGMIQGIADGDGMKLDPSGSATRAQIATILWRFCDTIMDN